MVDVDATTGSAINGNVEEHAYDGVACPVPPVQMSVRLAIEAPAITPSEPTPAIAPTEPVQLAPSEVDSGTERNAQTVTESNIKPETNVKKQEFTLETDRETTDRVP